MSNRRKVVAAPARSVGIQRYFGGPGIPTQTRERSVGPEDFGKADVDRFVEVATYASTHGNAEQYAAIAGLKGSGLTPIEATAAIIAAMGWPCAEARPHHHHEDAIGLDKGCGFETMNISDCPNPV